MSDPTAVRSVNRELEAKVRTLAGIKGYKTNLPAAPCPAEVDLPEGDRGA